MSLEEAKGELVRQWLEKARHDPMAVERVAEVDDLRDIFVFH
jgi:hypothetical protein